MNNYQSANQIHPNIWLGDVESAHDIDFLKHNNITVIINCTVSHKFIQHPFIKKNNKYRLPIRDNREKDQIDLLYQYPTCLPEHISTH